MHLSVAIQGGGGEVTQGNPWPFAQWSLQIPLPKTKIVWQKATDTPHLGANKCALPGQKVQYFKRVLLKE